MNVVVDVLLADGIIVVNDVVLNVKSEKKLPDPVGSIEIVQTMLVLVRITGVVQNNVDANAVALA